MTREPERREAPDELDVMARELHDALHGAAAGRTVDWARVEELRAARARGRRRIAAAGFFALAATVGAVLLVPRLLSSIAPSAGPPPCTAPPSVASSLAPDAPRVLFDDGRTRVLAAAGAVAAMHGSAEVFFEQGRVWVRVRRATDGSPLPGSVVCVRAPELRACVHGTAFEVSRPADAGGGTTVLVVEGSVQVTRPGDAVWLVTAGRRFAPPYAAPEPADAAALAAAAETLGLAPAITAVAALPAAAETPPQLAPPATTPPAATLATPEPGRTDEMTAVQAPMAPTTTQAGCGDDAGEPLDEVEALYRDAERALSEGRLDDALQLLGRVVEAAPASPAGGMAMIDIAAVHLRAGRPAEARRAFLRYLALQPAGSMREEARMHVCRIDAAAGRFADATSCYADYLAEFPDGIFAPEARRAAEASSGRELKRKR